MAITGTYAGQLFGLLIGFGLAMLKKTLMYGDQEFDIFSNINPNISNIMVCFIYNF